MPPVSPDAATLVFGVAVPLAGGKGLVVTIHSYPVDGVTAFQLILAPFTLILVTAGLDGGWQGGYNVVNDTVDQAESRLPLQWFLIWK